MELTALWKKISRAWAIGSTKAMRKVGRWRKQRSSSKTHDSSLCQLQISLQTPVQKTQRETGSNQQEKVGLSSEEYLMQWKLPNEYLTYGKERARVWGLRGVLLGWQGKACFAHNTALFCASKVAMEPCMTTIQQYFSVESWCGRTDGCHYGCREVLACWVGTQPVFWQWTHSAKLRGMHAAAVKRRIMPDPLMRDGHRYCCKWHRLRQEEAIFFPLCRRWAQGARLVGIAAMT